MMEEGVLQRKRRICIFKHKHTTKVGGLSRFTSSYYIPFSCVFIPLLVILTTFFLLLYCFVI